MDTIRVLSVILFVLVVLIRASDATSRVLMADEKPNSKKESPSPIPNSPPVNKELNQNPQPKPVESGPENKKEPQPVTKKDEGSKQSENSPNGKKDGGMHESKGTQNGGKDGGQKESKEPPKNDDKKKDDKVKEKNGPSKSPEDPKKDDRPKGGDGPAESEENMKKDGGTKKGEGPSTREENRKKDDGKQGGKGPNGDESHVDKSQLGTCDGSMLRCKQQDLVACLQWTEIADPKELAILIQNTGDNTLVVNIAVPPSVTIDAKKLKLAKHSSEKVNIAVGATKTLKIVLDAGKGQCVIPFGAGLSVSDWVQQFPAYARQLTPMYGAYFVFLILVIAGAVWGFCKFRRSRRRADDGVAYQQLEMGTQRQSSTEIVEEGTVDGWEQGWDDDWDEEEATTRPSTTRPNGNISANGLSSRSASKNNDWDIEWDD